MISLPANFLPTSLIRLYFKVFVLLSCLSGLSFNSSLLFKEERVRQEILEALAAEQRLREREEAERKAAEEQRKQEVTTLTLYVDGSLALHHS